MEGLNKVQEAANEIARRLDADVILCNGALDQDLSGKLMSLCSGDGLRENVLLILVTPGGNPDVAYRITRHLQIKYNKFWLFVTGPCKSAGTLVALGAHELIFADYGELGPLDVQMQKQDELWERRSGLTHHLALSVLQDNAFQTFERIFLQIKARGVGAITLRTAAEIATQITVGLFSPLYQQVDPLRVTEANRAMTIASEYGRRLLEEGNNSNGDNLTRLISVYPSHGFVIDRREAKTLFLNVNEPKEDERKLSEMLKEVAYRPHGLSEPIIVRLSSKASTKRDQTEKTKSKDQPESDE